MNGAAWGTVIVAAIAAAAPILNRLMDRRKVEADTGAVAVTAMATTVTTMREEMTAMHGEIRELRAEVGKLRQVLTTLRAEYYRLRDLVASLGGDPGPEIEDHHV